MKATMYNFPLISSEVPYASEQYMVISTQNTTQHKYEMKENRYVKGLQHTGKQ